MTYHIFNKPTLLISFSMFTPTCSHTAFFTLCLLLLLKHSHVSCLHVSISTSFLCQSSIIPSVAWFLEEHFYVTVTSSGYLFKEHQAPTWGQELISQTWSVQTPEPAQSTGVWCPALKGKGAPKVCRCLWLKGMTKVRGSTKSHKVFSVNYTVGMEVGMLVPNLLNEHTEVGFG